MDLKKKKLRNLGAKDWKHLVELLVFASQLLVVQFTHL